MPADASPQTSEFFAEANRMFLNVWTGQPDPSIEDFVRKYAPSLVPKHKGGWAAYPPLSEKREQGLSVHSIEFKEHPFFSANYLKGYLDLFSREGEPTPGLRHINVRFVFSAAQDAIDAFTSLCEKFTSLSQYPQKSCFY
jgi:hypothetical protein